MSASRNWHRFDVFHLKAKDGITQQTKIGAFMTILTVILVTLLLFVECRDYLKTDNISRMTVDNKSFDHNSITIEFGVQFYSVGCDKIEFVQENTRGAVMNIEPNAVVKKPSMSNDASSMGCIISGSIITDKVGGYFSFKIASENRNKNMFDPRFASMLHRDLTPVDLSHQIKHLMFMPTDRSIGRVIPKDVWPSDDKDHPLNGAIIRLDNSTGLYAYNLFVVPMTYKTIYGYEKHLNKYRVTEKAESLQNVLSRGVVIGLNSYRDISVVFDYDFYPIMLAINETREGFIEFIANLCGIIGGAITVLGLVDAALHKITKAGKRD